jgi:type IV secretion system protein VirD4
LSAFRTGPPRRPEASAAEKAGLCVAAGLLAAALLVWAAGELGALLARGRWPATPPSRSPSILVGLAAHPLDPAAAWPPPEGRVVPGPALFYADLAAEVASLAVGAAYVWTRWSRWSDKHSVPRSSSGAGWATRRDLRALEVREAGGGRLALGVCGRRLIATESRHSVIVVGPTQSHKTSGFAVPAVLEWEGPVLVTSVKRDIYDSTVSWRHRRGAVWLYDPAGSTGLRSDEWSPIQACGSWLGARRVAASLTASARQEGLSDSDFWYATASKLLAPLLFAAARSGRTMSDVVSWVDTQEVTEVADLLDSIADRDALRAAWATWRRDERQRSSVYTTAETVLEAFADPVRKPNARQIDIESLLDGSEPTLYLCAPPHEQERLRPAFAGLVHQVVTTAYSRVASQQGPLSPPLLVVLDEAANVAPLRDLDSLASTAAGHGVQLVTVWQDMAQITSRYGTRAATVVNNHRAKVVLSGISDPSTLEHVSTLIGDHQMRHSSTTRDHAGARSTTESSTWHRLAPAAALRRIRPGDGVLVYGHFPPARLRLRPWFESAVLAARVGVTDDTGSGVGPREGWWYRRRGDRRRRPGRWMRAPPRPTSGEGPCTKRATK